MKVLVIYDSQYGNTEKIAKAIGASITGEVKVVRASEANLAELIDFDIVIAGAPTQGGRPTQGMQEFLNKIPIETLKSKKVAAFDTRIPAKWVKIFGFAAGKIAGNLKNKGGNLVAPPEGFFVKNSKGPLADGELERAGSWAKNITKS